MKLLLSYHQAPGDTVISTGACQSILDQNPDVTLLVKGTASEPTFRHWPRVEAYKGQHYDLSIKMENPLIHKAHLHHHVLWSYCKTLSDALGYDVPLQYNRPVIHLSKEERGWISRVHEIKGESTPYMVINLCGAKKDFTIKKWPVFYMQEVVNALSDIVFVQVGNAVHDHQPLDGVINEIGKTDHRQLIRLIAHRDCKGVISGESLCWHLAAAFQKPAVCIAASWLSPSWVHYATGTVLHRMGCLPCCKNGACGKARVVPLGDGDQKDKRLCVLPMLAADEYVPTCTGDILPSEVVAAVQNYRRLGVA